MFTTSQDSLCSTNSIIAHQYDDLLKMIFPSNLALDEAALHVIKQIGIYYHSVEEVGHDDALLLACQYRQLDQ